LSFPQIETRPRLCKSRGTPESRWSRFHARYTKMKTAPDTQTGGRKLVRCRLSVAL